MINPISTYRIQFHKDFSFEDFIKVLPYLVQLGVSTIYASPIFAATPGSVHGYDGVNPNTINPEIGSEETLREISQALKPKDINWLQDIVPNHMAFHKSNEWLMDLLEKGPQSLYAPFFDVTWNGSLYHGRVMVPFLGSSLEEVIRNGELKIAYEENRFVFKYYDNSYPLQPRSYIRILNSITQQSQAIQQLLKRDLEEEDPLAFSESFKEFRMQLTALMKDSDIKKFINECLEEINNQPEKLQYYADHQFYRLCNWKESDTNINYRRFFTVNSLICLNIQDKAVFDEYHRLVKTLVEEGIFQGLRIDHIDGLYDPTQYLERLREIAGEETYITVEKILEPGEGLPKEWPIQGNTGYDFLAIVNNLFTNRCNEKAFTDFYKKLTNDTKTIHQHLHEKKTYILQQHMGGELENLYELLMQSGIISTEDYKEFRTEDIKEAIGEFLINCPVYRYYGNALPLLKKEKEDIRDIFRKIKTGKPHLSKAISLLENILLEKPREEDEEFNKKVLNFYQRCMQFTGPLMAKGVEDTLMYTYNRFINHNEVGDSPEAFGLSRKEFHQAMQERQEQWPLSINTTSTHDTKRGEDVRARLNVITDLGEEWFDKVQEWKSMNATFKQNGSPDNNDEYFIYQTLAGAYPMPGQDEDNIHDRMEVYLEKALREAKRRSNYTDPDTEYEEATKNFCKQLLSSSNPFLNDFLDFQEKIAGFGMLNSLVQVILKFTCPGVPDVYQGTELWDLSLVDPDNRRYVDYERRIAYLEEIESWKESREELVQNLWRDQYTGKIKLWLTHSLLKERKNNPELFYKGEYISLEIKGTYQQYILAFLRKYKSEEYIVVVPLHLAQLCKEQKKSIMEIDWMDTQIIIPEANGLKLQNVLLKNKIKAGKQLLVKELFNELPFALIKLENGRKRKAGILLHISSLPSPFGIGDLGPEAYNFARFLENASQTYWQLLPLNPTEPGLGHSPYSSISSKAGNTLFISPQLLAEDKLIDEKTLEKYKTPSLAQADYSMAAKIKAEIFEEAWKNFQSGSFEELQKDFKEFCSLEAKWLNDFALYLVIKNQQKGKSWFQWPEELKKRESGELEKISTDFTGELEKIKWLQFLFFKQWEQLRSFCNNRDISLVGDVPFYISYDSADVWSHQEIFALDEEGKMTGVAGVPPDAFSADGQLWGMPVFKWNILKQRNYDWWIQRFEKNMQLFDLVRLDHFRAFADYWEVPASETSATRGEWKTGPGEDIFHVIKKKLGSMPFIAEDLGEVNEAVFKLRDKFCFPGMKILQFAFSEEMPESDYIPHNYQENFIVYTGTHDNNTSRGWYRLEGKKDLSRLEMYTGKSISEEEAAETLIRLAYSSIASISIIPMQDLLNLDENSRMNTPSSGENNWLWRLLPGELTEELEKKLKTFTIIYNRR